MAVLQIEVDDKFAEQRHLEVDEIKEMVIMLLGLEQTKEFRFEEDLGIDEDTKSWKFRHVVGVNTEANNAPLSRIFTVRLNEDNDYLSIRGYDSLLVTASIQ